MVRHAATLRALLCSNVLLTPPNTPTSTKLNFVLLPSLPRLTPSWYPSSTATDAACARLLGRRCAASPIRMIRLPSAPAPPPPPSPKYVLRRRKVVESVSSNKCWVGTWHSSRLTRSIANERSNGLEDDVGNVANQNIEVVLRGTTANRVSLDTISVSKGPSWRIFFVELLKIAKSNRY